MNPSLEQRRRWVVMSLCPNRRKRTSATWQSEVELLQDSDWQVSWSRLDWDGEFGMVHRWSILMMVWVWDGMVKIWDVFFLKNDGIHDD